MIATAPVLVLANGKKGTQLSLVLSKKNMSKQQPLSQTQRGQRRSGRFTEFDVEEPKVPGSANPSSYVGLTTGMAVALMLGVVALGVGLAVGGFVGYFYDRENTRFGDIEDTLADLQAQIDNKTAVTTFPDDLFAIFHDADPSRRFCFDALQIGVGMKRTLTIQDGNGTVAYLADIPVDRAPNDATYLTLSTDSELTSERVLVMDAGNFDTSDFGPNSAFVVDLSDTGVVAATYTRATIEVDIKGRILSASSNAPGNVSTGAFIDDMFMVASALDSTRIVMLDVGSVSDFTTRTMTIPNLDGILALTTGTQTFTDKTLVGSSNTIEASAVRTTGSPVDFATAAPPTVGQIPVFDGVSAINWENVSMAAAAEFLAVTGGPDVNVGLSAPPGGAGYQLITTSPVLSEWTAVPVVASGSYSPGLSICGNQAGAGVIAFGRFNRVGDVITTYVAITGYTQPVANFLLVCVRLASLPVTRTGNFGSRTDATGHSSSGGVPSPAATNRAGVVYARTGFQQVELSTFSDIGVIPATNAIVVRGNFMYNRV